MVNGTKMNLSCHRFGSHCEEVFEVLVGLGGLSLVQFFQQLNSTGPHVEMRNTVEVNAFVVQHGSQGLE